MLRRDRELNEELEAHLKMAIRDRIERGQSPADAERDAHREFGNLLQVKEVTRESWRWAGVETLVRDIRYGGRMLGRTPGLTAIVALSLALGIGANTAIFSVLNGWLLRPLPVRAPEQIVVLASHQKERRGTNISYPDLVDLRKPADAFSDVFGQQFGIGGMTVGGEVSLFAYSAVTGNYFTGLGIQPVAGRLFLPGEGEKPGEPLRAVLGYAYWQKRFGGDSGAIGRQVRVNGKPAIIIGVTPPEFHGTLFSATMDGYLTLNAISLGQRSSTFWTNRGDRGLTVLARLKEGVGLRKAQSSVDVAARRLAAAFPTLTKA